jgi:hypothetical protein
MIVDDKIKESEYFLDMIKSKPFTAEFNFIISAFLCATRSIADYLLEDYNVKFGQRISLDEKLYVSKFEKKAQILHNSRAIAFIHDYKREFSELSKEGTIGDKLINKRNIKVHRRKTDSLMLAKAHSEDTIKLLGSHSAVLYDLNGNVIQRSNSRTGQEDNNLQKLNESKKTITTKWYFNEYPDEEAAVICEKFLNMMKNFRNSIVKKYP